jgi:uncharacterized protein (TIGR00296 family)
LTDDQGIQAVRLARETLESFVGGSRPEVRRWKEGFLSEKRGAFVTLNTTEFGPETLRGCIGFSEPVMPLGEAIQVAAVEAAAEDPRFRPVEPRELPLIVVEVSVLTLPKELKPVHKKDTPGLIRLGTDGIIVSRPEASALFLPQVATETHWDAETFLSEACMKGGMPPDAWLADGTRVQVFQAEVFAETAPRGAAARVED